MARVFKILMIILSFNLTYGNVFEILKPLLKRKLIANIQDFFELRNNISIPIENTCLASYKNLAHVSSEFIQCVANYSRPYHVCQNCLVYYLKLNDAYTLIRENTDVYAKTLYKNGLTCENIVDATDRVQTVVRISNIIREIWHASRCEDCFESYNITNGTVNFTLKDYIIEFYQIQQDLEICINNFTKKPSSLDPLFQEYEPNANLCTVCKLLYINLTNHFSNMAKLLGKDENNMCMDPVDLFNYTRIAWSKGYKCNYRKIDEINIFLISGMVILVTALFYLYAGLKKTEEERQVLKISRRRGYTLSKLTKRS